MSPLQKPPLGSPGSDHPGATAETAPSPTIHARPAVSLRIADLLVVRG
jgi:hypothetical protein